MMNNQNNYNRQQGGGGGFQQRNNNGNGNQWQNRNNSRNNSGSFSNQSWGGGGNNFNSSFQNNSQMNRSYGNNNMGNNQNFGQSFGPSRNQNNFNRNPNFGNNQLFNANNQNFGSQSAGPSNQINNRNFGGNGGNKKFGNKNQFNNQGPKTRGIKKNPNRNNTSKSKFKQMARLEQKAIKGKANVDINGQTADERKAVLLKIAREAPKNAQNWSGIKVTDGIKIGIYDKESPTKMSEERSKLLSTLIEQAVENAKAMDDACKANITKHYIKDDCYVVEFADAESRTWLRQIVRNPEFCSQASFLVKDMAKLRFRQGYFRLACQDGEKFEKEMARIKGQNPLIEPSKWRLLIGKHNNTKLTILLSLESCAELDKVNCRIYHRLNHCNVIVRKPIIEEEVFI